MAEFQVGNPKQLQDIVNNTDDLENTTAGLATAANQATEIANLRAINSLVPSIYDYIELSYSGSNLSIVVFKTGGSSGTVVSTLSLAYNASDNLISVTKT